MNAAPWRAAEEAGVEFERYSAAMRSPAAHRECHTVRRLSLPFSLNLFKIPRFVLVDADQYPFAVVTKKAENEKEQKPEPDPKGDGCLEITCTQEAGLCDRRIGIGVNLKAAALGAAGTELACIMHHLATHESEPHEATHKFAVHDVGSCPGWIRWQAPASRGRAVHN